MGRRTVGTPYRSVRNSDPYLAGLISAYLRHLPATTEDFPDLSPQQIAEFHELGEQARGERLAGNYLAATAALQKQIGIARSSPGPYAEVATIYALQGDLDSSNKYLREAVVRGFDDLGQYGDSPGYQEWRITHEFRTMQRSVPHLQSFGRNWNRWSRFEAATPPTGVEEVEHEYALYRDRLEQVSSVLGPRLTKAWEQWIDFAAAALLEQYVEQTPYAPDLQAAIVWLFKLYSDSDQFRWETLSGEAADRLQGISRVVLERFPEQNLRADAWVASALATYSKARTKRGDSNLGGRASREIEKSLGFVLTQHPNSPRRFDATLGLILVASANDEVDRARTLYEDLVERFGEDAALMARARDDLGDLTLRLGGLPEFRVATLGGATLDSASLNGNVILLDFWATWCGPCVDEFDDLRKLLNKHTKDGLQVIGWSMDHQDELTTDGLQKWLAQNGVQWPQVFDGQAWDSEIAERLAVDEIPYNVLIAADGSVLGTDLHGRDLEKAVASAIRSRRASK